jgi:hypothetical protein
MVSPEPEQTTVPATHPTAILRSPAFLGHNPGQHPEHPDRLRAIERELERADLLGGRPTIPFGEASDAAITRIHRPEYLRRLEALAVPGGAWLDLDTMVAPDSVHVARLAAGAAIAAVDATLNGQIRRAFALVRPPGHHATPTRGMGFCLLNNVAIATTHALAQGVARVAIIDWDVHQATVRKKRSTRTAAYSLPRSTNTRSSLLPVQRPSAGTAAAREQRSMCRSRLARMMLPTSATCARRSCRVSRSSARI